MSEYATLAVSPDVAKVFSVGTPSDRTVLHVRPPESGPGIDQAADLVKSVHHVDVEESLLSTNVNSKLSAFEMWYQNEQLDFYFVLPDEEEEDHYRRQISGYYSGVHIQEETLKQNQFPDIQSGRSIAATRLGAAHHVFEPLWMVGEGGDDEKITDPYRPILNEVDSKTNLSVMIQVLYKPLPESWETINGTTLREYSRRLEEDGILDEKWFGQVKRRVNDETLQSKGANAIRSQIGVPAFLTEVRLAVAADGQKTAQTELDALVDLFKNTYRGTTGQTLEPVGGDDAEDLLSHMIARKMKSDGLPSGLRGKLKLEMKGTAPTLICSVPELAGLAHLPNSDAVSVTGVNYTKALVEGTLPPSARTFSPVTEQEKRESQQQHGDTA